MRGSEDRLWVQGDLVGRSEVWLTMDSKLQLQNEDNGHSIESRGERNEIVLVTCLHTA